MPTRGRIGRWLSHWTLAGLSALLMAGCASTVPEPIRQSLPAAPSVEEVRTDPESHGGKQVRWGGTLLSVENRTEGTRLEVLAYPLEGSGRPREDAPSPGRFLADLDRMADPAIFTVGRAITVVGQVDGSVQGQIGDYTYAYPLVAAGHHYLWPARVQRPDPIWCDPWYDPWYDPYYYRPWSYRRYPCW